MGRRKTDRIPKLFSCGGIAVPTGKNIIPALKKLQCLMRLKAMGLKLEGNSVSILRMKYDASNQQDIEKTASMRGGLLVFRDEYDSTGEKKIRWRKKKVVIRELIAAACSDELFALIDIYKELFLVMTEEEMSQFVSALWSNKARSRKK